MIDFGSAITVDFVSAAGSFLGGAILPGINMSARALHEFTDLLPAVDVVGPPAALGRSTIEALQSGLYWGVVGAVKELIDRLSTEAPKCEVFVTGGAAPGLVGYFADSGRHAPREVPHLTLAGIAVSVTRQISSAGVR